MEVEVGWGTLRMKSIEALSKILSDAKRSGAYCLTGKVDAMERAAKGAGLSIIKLDIGRVRGKSGFLSKMATTLKFPRHFGRNWDALHDCLTDLSWLDTGGWLIVITNFTPFAKRHKKDFSLAIEVLASAAEYWRGQDKPFWVLVQGESNWDLGLPQVDQDLEPISS